MALIYIVLSLEPDLWISCDDSCVCYNLQVRGAIYFDNNHFTERVVSSTGMIWFHDGIFTGHTLIYESQNLNSESIVIHKMLLFFSISAPSPPHKELGHAVQSSGPLAQVLHNNSSSSNLALGLIQAHGIPINLFSASSGLENGSGGRGDSGEYDYQRQQVAGSYFWRYPLPVVDRLIRGFFLYLDISVEKVCFRRAEASSTIALRGLGYQITTDAC